VLDRHGVEVRRTYQAALAVVIIMASSAAPASADMGVPMIALYLPPAWALLLPIMLVEALVGWRKWRIPLKAAITSQAVANGVSTLLGVPVAWLFLAGVELTCCGTALGLGSGWRRAYAVTVQAPWLIPYEDDLKWMIPIALGVLSLIFCALSIACEFPIVRLMVAAEHRPHVWPWVVRANLVSYAGLYMVFLLATWHERAFQSIWRAFSPISDSLIDLAFQLAKLISG
jgi:hypothetical protein